MLDGCLDRAAIGVTKDDHERHLQFGDRIFDAAFHGDASTIDNIAGHTDYE
jgi:hypothetical protein